MEHHPIGSLDLVGAFCSKIIIFYLFKAFPSKVTNASVSCEKNKDGIGTFSSDYCLSRSEHIVQQISNRTKKFMHIGPTPSFISGYSFFVLNQNQAK